MKVIGISGSPRKNGNTEIAVQMALDTLTEQGIETELISLAERPVLPCKACGGCSADKVNPKCAQQDPAFGGIIEKFIEADGVIVASPVYFGSATPETMALLDRVGCVARRSGSDFLRRKVGASIAVARRAGQNFTFAQLNYFFLISEMIVPGSTYWNVAFGHEPGQIREDEEGVATITTLAENMGWLMKKLA